MKKIMKQARWMMLALILPLFSVASARAGVFISVSVAPPMLPVYEQPPCPQPDLMWVPGYWAYDYDAQSYYWVPGAWVPAPYEGALWTPPYWGWNEGLYVFHPGYWGEEVGYYGGVNYGWGYFGLGFVGGRWNERHFEYNEAVVHVNRTYIHETYIDRTVVREHVIDERHVAYAGGPGGVRHEPNMEERRAMQVQHVPPTQYQQQHIQQARSERQNFFNVNHGRPQVAALARPLPAQHVTPPPAVRSGAQVSGNAGARVNNMPANNGAVRSGAQQQQPGQRTVMGPPAQTNRQMPQGHSMPAQPQQPQYRPQPQQPQTRPEPQYRPAPQQPQPRPEPQYRPAPQQPQPRPEPQYRPQPQQPQPRPEPQYRPAPQPQSQYRPAPQPQYRPEPQYRPAPQPQYRPEPQYRAAPQAQYRPAPEPQYHAAPQPQYRPAPAPRAEHESRPAPERDRR